MEGLNLKAIPVHYAKAMIMGVEREARVKTWFVAVKTEEPGVTFASFTEWMIYIQLKHAQLVANISEHEHNEVTAQVNRYAGNFKANPKFLKLLNS